MKNLLINTLNKFVLSYTILLCICCNISNAQNLNKKWHSETGSPVDLRWTHSITDANMNLLTVGNTAVNGEGANIYLTKHGIFGQLIWQANFNSSGNANDYGVSISTDQFNNIYVVGSTDNNTNNNHDIIILKYNTTGALLWSYIYNSSFNLNDAGTAIKPDGNGNVYVCGASEGINSNYDYVLLKLNPSGSLIWEKRYDFANLTEIPIGVDIDVSGNIYVTGASANSLTDWDFAVVFYNSDGEYIDAVRNSLPGIGFDQPRAYTKDALGNIYITGSGSSDGFNYDVKTIKVNTNHQIEWVKTYDFKGKEDVANSIDIDEQGNLIIGGFVTRNDNVKELFALKYDNDGNEIWFKNQTGRIASEDLAIKALEVQNDAIYFIAERKNANATVMVSKMDKTGEIAWQKNIRTQSDETPSSIKVINDGIYVTSIKDSIIPSYQTYMYSEFSQDTSITYNEDGKPIYKSNELIIRFLPSALKTEIVSNREIEFGTLEEFLTPEALSTFNQALNYPCSIQSLRAAYCINAVKVFKQLVPSQTHTVSRLGETIPIPDFWTTLLVIFPEGFNIKEIHDALETVPNIIAYSEPNLIIELTGANDPEYLGDQETGQYSLHNINNVYPEINHINSEEAWEIYPAAGNFNIKCGIFDSGVDFKHLDFGYDGVERSSSVVVDGWDFKTLSSNEIDFYDFDGHGTKSAGIIGAIRNNNIGIAGIAGGNYTASNDNSDKGVSLYSLKIAENDRPVQSTLAYANDAMVMTAIDDHLLYQNYNYGLHLSNNSWGFGPDLDAYFTLDNINLIRDALRFVNRAKVTFVASRGNSGNDNDYFPATMDDDWVISVGGTGINGHYKYEGNGEDNSPWEPSIGKNLDVAAPCITDLIVTTSLTNQFNNNFYIPYNGTSAAAPHVTGVVALMMGYFNDSVPSYRNLAPEDSERIIELSATDVNQTGYDDSTGYGRVNAGRAMRYIERPWADVKHFGTNNLSAYTKTKTLTALNQNIELTEKYQNTAGIWFNSGNYKVDAYRINAIVSHSIDEEDSVIAYWPRPSSSTVLEPIVTTKLRPRERLSITDFSDSSCTMHGFVYKVYDENNNYLGWWPFDTTLTQANFEYTILTRKKNAPIITTSIDTHQELMSSINVYPNPTNDSHTIRIQTTENHPIKIDLYNLQGRLLRTVYNQKSSSHDLLIPANVADLSSSIYFYQIQIGEELYQFRFIKQ